MNLAPGLKGGPHHQAGQTLLKTMNMMKIITSMKNLLSSRLHVGKAEGLIDYG